MIIFAILLLILLPQICAAYRCKSAALRVALLIPGCAGAASVSALYLNRYISLSSAENGVYYDTYYVVAHFHLAFAFAIILGLLAALLFWADPAHRPLPKITRWLATILAFSTAALLTRPFVYSTFFSPPRRYVEYTGWLELIGRVQLLTNILFSLTWLILFTISLTAVFRRLNGWSKTR